MTPKELKRLVDDVMLKAIRVKERKPTETMPAKKRPLMNVATLIELLKTFDPELPITGHGYKDMHSVVAPVWVGKVIIF